MKTIFLSVVAAVGLLPTTVNSQIVNFPIPCTDITTLSEVLDKHGEKAAMTMSSSREIRGRVIESSTVLFINYETKTWTLAEQINDETYCVVAMGDSIRPYLK